MDLPKVTQEFDANTLPYISAVEAAISATKDFTKSVDQALAAVLALETAIAGLDGKTIHINVETSGVPEAAAAAAGAQGAAPDTAATEAATKATEENAAAANTDAAANERLGNILKEEGGDWQELGVLANAGSEANRNAAASADEAAGSFKRDAESLAEVGLSYRQMVEQGILPADSALKGAAESGDGAAASFERAGESVRNATIPFETVGAATRDAGTDLLNLRNDAENTGVAFGVLGTAAAGIVGAFDRLHTTWQNTNVAWGLSLNALHWIVMGSAELLAVAVPAMVAFGAAGLVAMQGVQETGNRLQSIYTTTEALGGAFNVTAGNVLGLKSVLQQAQDAADPLVWEALGAAINGVKVMGGGFVQMGTQVLQIFDRWAAAVDIELAGAFGKNLTGILSKGAQDLTAFGQVFGNIGHIIVNLASEMPGVAEVILGFVAGLTKVIALLTSPALAGGNFVTLAMGIEEAWRWGGLLGNVLGSIATKLGSWVSSAGNAVSKVSLLGQSMEGAGAAVAGLGSKMEAAGAVLSGPWGWVIIGAIAGLTLLAIKLGETKTAAQQFVSGMEQAVSGAQLTQGFAKATTDLTDLQGKLQGVNVATAAVAVTASRGGTAWSGAADNAKAYAQGQQQIVKDGAAVVSFGAQVSTKFGVSVPDAFNLAAMAGLKVNQIIGKNGEVSQVALQQIQNLIQGYSVMSGNSTALGNNINAVNYQLGLQNTQVSKLNSAWDQFIGVVTGGTSAWASMQDDLQQLGNTAATVGGKIKAFSGTTGSSVSQVSSDLKSFSGDSAQVWQSFDQSITQANTNLDWWRTAAASGAANAKQLTQATATTTAAFLPYIAQSKAALSETMAVAQEQGGPAYNAAMSLSQNYQNLKNWTDKNALSTNAYNQMLSGTTAQLSNVSNAAKNFSQTLQGDVAQAVAAGSVNLNQLTKNTQQLTSDLKTNGATSQVVSTDINNMATQFHGAGMNAQSAASLIYQLAVDQGLSSSAASKLAGEMTTAMNNIHGAGNAANSTAGDMRNSANAMYGARDAAVAVANAVNDIPNSKNVYVNVQEAITGTVGVGGILPTPSGHAAGYLVPGYGGGDVHPALLEGGEIVVPKELSPAVAPMMKAHGVPGFEGGGIMSSSGGYGTYGGGGGYAGPSRVTIELNGRKLADAMMPDLVGGTNRYARRNTGRSTGVLRP